MTGERHAMIQILSMPARMAFYIGEQLGDFGGVDQKGVPHGLLFPASLDLSKNGQFL
jgi:hypothetical protein